MGQKLRVRIWEKTSVKFHGYDLERLMLYVDKIVDHEAIASNVIKTTHFINFSKRKKSQNMT